jgi:hypothetical protein
VLLGITTPANKPKIDLLGRGKRDYWFFKGQLSSRDQIPIEAKESDVGKKKN